jgi:hypothetical protein
MDGSAARFRSKAFLRAAGKLSSVRLDWPLYFRAMSDRIHNDFHVCPCCGGSGRIPSRLPARTRPCDDCGGKGIVTPIKRQQLLKRLERRQPQV